MFVLLIFAVGAALLSTSVKGDRPKGQSRHLRDQKMRCGHGPSPERDRKAVGELPIGDFASLVQDCGEGALHHVPRRCPSKVRMTPRASSGD